MKLISLRGEWCRVSERLLLDDAERRNEMARVDRSRHLQRKRDEESKLEQFQIETKPDET